MYVSSPPYMIVAGQCGQSDTGTHTQAAKRTADIREEVEASLRQFREKLEDVERVVAVFADEEDVITAALNVLVSVLQAIEDIIYYYSEKKGPKMGMALLERDEYKADLSECLLGIESSSKRLIEKATIVNFREMHAVDIKTSEGEHLNLILNLTHYATPCGDWNT